MEDAGIYIMDTDGSNIVRVATGSEPCWSPDGYKIAFSHSVGHNMDIYTINIDGTEETRITDHIAPDISPSFSPDGNKIVYTLYYDIHVINADGTGDIQLTDYPDPAYDCYHPAWSPLGDKIVYMLMFFDGEKFHHYLYKINPDGTDNVPLTEDGIYYNPCWSPDGSKIAYEFKYETTGETSLWIMNADGTNKIRLTNTFYDCEDPSWGAIIEK